MGLLPPKRTIALAKTRLSHSDTVIWNDMHLCSEEIIDLNHAFLS